MRIFDDTVLDRMKRFLDVSMQKQQIISSNLANADTPGYRALELDFSEALKQELQGAGKLKTSQSRHLPAAPVLHREPPAREANSGSLGNDLNNVNLDHEMTQLAENVLRFSAVAQFIQAKIKGLESSIRGS
jgi:flagellar basal-body rod protein FlgB